MKTGDIGFIIHNDNKLSKVIAWFMGSKWSHTFIVLEETSLGYLICETSDYEVKYSFLGKYLDDPNVDMEIYSLGDVDNEQMVYDNCQKIDGQLYGYLQLFSFGVRSLLSRIGIKIDNFVFQGIICCQVAYEAVKGTSIEIKMPKNKFQTEELFEYCKKNGKLVLKK